MAGSGVMDHLAERFEGSLSGRDICKRAIDFERESIVFLAAMRNILDDRSEQLRIDGIIREELGHIFQLTSQLAT